jgi:hypothetical protein
VRKAGSDIVVEKVNMCGKSSVVLWWWVMNVLGKQ